jgi:quercetin dioxygenase-like cupin family protein
MATPRLAALETVIALTDAAITARTRPGSEAARAMSRVRARIGSARPSTPRPEPRQQPACRHLQQALATARIGGPDLALLADAIVALAPAIHWRQRPSDDPAFMAGHASAPLVGPEETCLEQRPDVRVGISLMAPGIEYPDHRHPPEEVYIALSRGWWRQNADPWIEPGLGGIVYNPPDIIHAMRSSAEPLLAIWSLPVD